MLWYKLNERKPVAIEKGPWDGLRTKPILVATRNQTIHIALMYEEIAELDSPF